MQRTRGIVKNARHILDVTSAKQQPLEGEYSPSIRMALISSQECMHHQEIAYYPGPTGEFTGSSVGHNYLRKNGMHLRIVALNRSLRDLSIGV